MILFDSGWLRKILYKYLQIISRFVIKRRLLVSLNSFSSIRIAHLNIATLFSRYIYLYIMQKWDYVMTCYMTKVAMCMSIWEFNMLFFILRQFQKFCMSESNFLSIFHTNLLVGFKLMERKNYTCTTFYIWEDHTFYYIQ